MQPAALLPLAGALAQTIVPPLVDTVGDQVDSFLNVLHRVTDPVLNSTDRAAGGAVPLSGDGSLAQLSVLREQLATDLAAWIEDLQVALHRQGIDLEHGLELVDDGRGRPIEVSGHPQRASIEAILSADSTLATGFHELSERFSSLAGDTNEPLRISF